jgi:hypothetical protein
MRRRVAYWVLRFSDHGVVAGDHTAEYISFEQSFRVRTQFQQWECDRNSVSTAHSPLLPLQDLTDIGMHLTDSAGVAGALAA